MQIDDSSYLNICTTGTTNDRYLSPSDIYVAPGYTIEVYVQGLDSPIDMLFTEEGDLVVAESGITTGNPRIIKLVNNNFEVIAEHFNVPITGMNTYEGVFYISHRGYVSRIMHDGTRQNIISGLPSNGDYYNGKVAFGPDRKMYFGQGTATNSGVVGNDNTWVTEQPLVCDFPGDFIMVYGQNFSTYNITNEFKHNEVVYTGAYSPYSIQNYPNEVKKGYIRASGSILRTNLDGTELELVAWGLRNPLNIKFDEGGNLYAANIGYDNRGSRPIANAPDELFTITPGLWYGWPDFAGGEPVTAPRFRPEGGNQPAFLIKNHPNNAPTPFITFPNNSNIMGFDFNYSTSFGQYGDIYIAEYGSIEKEIIGSNISYAGTGHRISRVDMKSRSVNTFAMNKSGFPSSITKEGGFGRPVDVTFGPDGAMYILDSGVENHSNPNVLLPNTGVIWRITKKSN